MPVVDLSVRYCYRFVEPIQMIWQNDGRQSLTMQLQMTFGGSATNNIMADFLLRKYAMIIEESKNTGNWHESLNWLENINRVNIVECEVTPKNETLVQVQIQKLFKRNN